MGPVKKILRFVLPAVIVLAGIALAKYFLATRPAARMREPAAAEILVRVEPLARGNRQVIVKALGSVEPARGVDIGAQVSGKIVFLDPRVIPGGFIAEGGEIARIETGDFELALRQKQSEVIKAEHDLALEMGEQKIAGKEYSFLNVEPDEKQADIILRRPQLKLAQSRVDAARAALEEAALNLRRTSVTAPFDAIVREKFADLGSQAAASAPIARIAGTDEYWVRLSVPVDELRWLRIPFYNSDTGSEVKIYHQSAWEKGKFRRGRIIRLAGELQPMGLMAQVMVKVEDPMCRRGENRNEPVLLLGMFVRAECEGVLLENVFAVSRNALREADTVWLMDADNKLEIRPVRVLRRGKDTVLIDEGLNQGERLIVTDLSLPVGGIALREEDKNSSPGEGQR